VFRVTRSVHKTGITRIAHSGKRLGLSSASPQGLSKMIDYPVKPTGPSIDTGMYSMPGIQTKMARYRWFLRGVLCFLLIFSLVSGVFPMHCIG
jgi:hypothetical protein